MQTVIYDAQTNGHTVEFTSNKEQALAALETSMARDKKLYMLYPNGRKVLVTI